MIVSASGQVGIGTTTPNFPLNVHITASNVALASFHGTGNSALSTPIGITFGTRTDAGSGTSDQRAGVFYIVSSQAYARICLCGGIQSLS